MGGLSPAVRSTIDHLRDLGKPATIRALMTRVDSLGLEHAVGKPPSDRLKLFATKLAAQAKAGRLKRTAPGTYAFVTFDVRDKTPAPTRLKSEHWKPRNSNAPQVLLLRISEGAQSVVRVEEVSSLEIGGQKHLLLRVLA